MRPTKPPRIPTQLKYILAQILEPHLPYQGGAFGIRAQFAAPVREQLLHCDSPVGGVLRLAHQLGSSGNAAPCLGEYLPGPTFPRTYCLSKTATSLWAAPF